MNSARIAPKIAAFIYHEVTDNADCSGFHKAAALPYKHGIKEFEIHLDQISQSSADICLVYSIDFSLPHSHILLTFDDGGISAMHIADTIEKRGWKGHFFITTSRLNTSNFLSSSDIRDLISRGHIIGSHSHTHPDIFYDLSREEMLEEWNISCDMLSQIVSKKINTASVPGGDMNELTQATALETGIKYLFTSEPTFHPWKYKDMICFGRVCPKRGTAPHVVYDLAHFKGFYYQIAIRKIKQTAKKVLFPYYQWKVSHH